MPYAEAHDGTKLATASPPMTGAASASRAIRQDPTTPSPTT